MVKPLLGRILCWLGFHDFRMVSSWSSHCFSSEQWAHDGGNTYTRPFAVQSLGSISLTPMLSDTFVKTLVDIQTVQIINTI
jgi:hypothetical protein